MTRAELEGNVSYLKPFKSHT